MRAQKWFGLGLGGAIMVLTLSLGAQRGEHVVERLLTTTDRATFDRARGELLSQWGSTMAGHAYAATEAEVAQNERLRGLLETFRGRFARELADVAVSDYTRQLDARRESALYGFLRSMPKGALLHTHLWGMLAPEFLIETHRTNPLAVVFTREDDPKTPLYRLGLSQRVPNGWRRLGEFLDESSSNAERVVEALRFRASVPPSERWASFERRFEIEQLHRSAASLEAHLRHALDRAREHGVQIVEAKVDLRGLARGPGDYLTEAEAVSAVAGIVERYRAEQPEMHFAIQVSLFRFFDARTVRARLEQIVALARVHPELIVGVDLCGREDGGTAVAGYADALLWLRAQTGHGLHLSLHAGETHDGNSTEVIDAVLLGAERIGHGLTIWKQPPLFELIKARRTVLEVSPISNQLLGFVPDFRDHPALAYFRSGVPVVLATDDEGFFGTDLTLEFLEAAVAWKLDLWQLKRLAENSIEFSFIDEEAKDQALQEWRRRWVAWCAGG